jgi:hypothetical protein
VCLCGKINKQSLTPSRNITIATFSEFGFYKKEGYEANLWAGKILAEHGVPVAYKSVSKGMSVTN